MNAQLDDFYSHLNEAVVTTNDFEEGTKFRKRSKVKEFAYCGLNPMYRRYLSFDLDDPGSAFKYESMNLPAPTIITINPENAHCHYLYHLKTPVAYHMNSRAKPQQFFEAVQDTMTECLKADKAYTHRLTKNPLHPKWQVITHPTTYDLNDFLEYIDLPKRSYLKPLTGNIEIRGRNDHLFHTLRFWGYGAVHQYINEESWQWAAQVKAAEINDTFESKLPLKEVNNTAKSTARWIWKNRHNLRTSAKVLSFTDETAKQRMSAGAQYTNGLRTAKAILTLKQAVVELTSMSKIITPINLQHQSGLNIRTVRKYLSELLPPDPKH